MPVPVFAHVILFEDINFGGRHTHVFRDEDYVGDKFNDITSSFVILNGKWQFFADENFHSQMGPELGPGLYPWIEDQNALGPGTNDKLSSLKGLQALMHEFRQVVLFEDINFGGKHTHAFADPNHLNLVQTYVGNYFNDITSSFVILDGEWQFFADANFHSQMGQNLAPGLYPWIEDQNALGPGTNDKLSSLKPVS
jgi:hypothetical protein